MPTPTKPFTVLNSEKKSHRTKKEMKMREQGEKALSSGVAMRERKEVKNNKVAHVEFKRINELLRNIQKNDAIYETVINRYCSMYAECVDMEQKREKIYEQVEKFENKLDELENDASIEDLKAITDSISRIYGTIISLDKQIQTKRKMLLDIEKENIMTIASALRAIPKKEEQPQGLSLKEILGGG